MKKSKYVIEEIKEGYSTGYAVVKIVYNDYNDENSKELVIIRDSESAAVKFAKEIAERTGDPVDLPYGHKAAISVVYQYQQTPAQPSPRWLRRSSSGSADTVDSSALPAKHIAESVCEYIDAYKIDSGGKKMPQQEFVDVFKDKIVEVKEILDLYEVTFTDGSSMTRTKAGT